MTLTFDEQAATSGDTLRTPPPPVDSRAARKIFVLDTSVLLSAPNAIHQFAEHEVVIPLVVITELEAKRGDSVLGFPAREALRGIEALRERARLASTSLREGVVVNDHGGLVRVEINHIDSSTLPDALRNDRSNDKRILAVAHNLHVESRTSAHPEGREVVVVSKDMPLRILAETLGLRGEEYRNEMVVVDRAYTGMEEANVTEQVLTDLYQRGTLDEFDTDLTRVTTTTATGDGCGPAVLDLPANTGLRLISPRGSALAIVRPGGSLQRVEEKTEAFGVRGRSAEQKIALDHLLNPEIGIVSLGGRAGTGKTYTALAAGLEQTLEQGRFKKVIVFRPLFAVGGQELGFLPGSAEEKMSPWGAAIFDALATMTTKEVVEELLAREMLEVLPLTHLRGRSLTDAFVIVDEAQNLERPVLLTALTRLGENTKIALSWDAAQRDNARVGRYDGIAAIVERLKGQPLFAHVTFTRSERGPIAELATRLLDDLV